MGCFSLGEEDGEETGIGREGRSGGEERRGGKGGRRWGEGGEERVEEEEEETKNRIGCLLEEVIKLSIS